MIHDIRNTFDALWISRPREVKIRKQVAYDRFLEGALNTADFGTPSDSAVRNYADHNAKNWWLHMGILTGQMLGKAPQKAVGRWA
jgi:hypothetical protein